MKLRTPLVNKKCLTGFLTPVRMMLTEPLVVSVRCMFWVAKRLGEIPRHCTMTSLGMSGTCQESGGSN